MKKALLFAVATAVAASASAVDVTSAKMVPAFQKDAALLNSAQTVSAVKDNTPAGKTFSTVNLRTVDNGVYQLNPVYRLPKGGFSAGPFAYNGSNWYSNHMVFPTYTDLTFVADTYVGAFSQSTPDFNDWDSIVYNWTSPNYVPGKGNVMTSFVGPELTIQLGANLDIYPMYTPEYEMIYEELTDTCSYKLSMQAGGSPLIVIDGNVQNLYIFNYPTYYSNFLGYGLCPEAYAGVGQLFGPGQIEAFPDGATANQYRDYFLSQRFNEGLPNDAGQFESSELLMYAFTIGYAGAPYTLSSLSLGVDYIASKDTKINFRFCVLNEDGSVDQDQVVYQYTCNVPASTDEMNTDLVIPFTSLDEFDEELSYITVNTPLMVLIDGFEEMDFFTPIACGYDRETLENYLVDFNAYSIYNIKGSNSSIEGVAYAYNVFAYGSGDGSYKSYRAFDVTMEAEYPNLAPYAYQYGENFIESDENAVHYINHRSDETYCVDLPKGESTVSVILATSAEYADELYIDDSELPEWLSYDVEDIYEVGDGDLINGVHLVFTATGDYAKRMAQLPIYYKNKSITLEISQDGASSIDNVAAAGNGAVTYFDLQGRKLNAAPAAGFYFQREGNKVTKVIR